MKDRRLGQAIIVIGCLLLVTQLISPVMAAVFVLSGEMSWKERGKSETQIREERARRRSERKER